MKVLSNELIADVTFELILENKGLKVTPGQFMHIKVPDQTLILRRPISIAKFDEHQIHLIYKVVGDGTACLSQVEVGEKLDALGPLGTGFPLEKGNILIVGGGMGVAPLYQLAKSLRDENLTIVLGFGNQSMMYYVDKFEKLGRVYLTTDDGSVGVKGHVGTVLSGLGQFDAVYACGPIPLLYNVQKNYENLDKVYVSLEERMACGIGACYACDTKDKQYRVCHDGPVFKAKEVTI